MTLLPHTAELHTRGFKFFIYKKLFACCTYVLVCRAQVCIFTPYARILYAVHLYILPVQMYAICIMTYTVHHIT
jgi:hypothetical protein